VGERFSIEVLRQGRAQSLQARIADPFAGYVDGASVHRQFRGALLGEVIDESGLGRNPGIAVGRVVDGSNAWQSGLREGDVVFQVNRVRVATLEEMRAAAAEGVGQIRLRRDDRLVTLVSR
jgi:S1-C subfamily serine protease